MRCETGGIQLGGPFLDAKGDMAGSLIIFEAANLDAATQLARRRSLCEGGPVRALRGAALEADIQRLRSASSRGHLMAYWLFKSEPETWSWEMQKKKGAKGEPWSGVRNHQAKLNMMKMKKGERGFFYHSGDAREIVGIVEVIGEYRPDPTDETGKFGLVDVKAVRDLPKPVTLGAGQGRSQARQDDLGDVFTAVGAAGHGRGVEAHLRNRRCRRTASVADRWRRFRPASR